MPDVGADGFRRSPFVPGNLAGDYGFRFFHGRGASTVGHIPPKGKRGSSIGLGDPINHRGDARAFCRFSPILPPCAVRCQGFVSITANPVNCKLYFMSRIIFPNKFSEQVDLLDNVAQKNTVAGKDSILAPYLKKEEFDLTADQAAAKTATDHNAKADSLKGLSEKSTLDRDDLMATVTTKLKETGQFLKKFHRKNIKEMEAYGFVVTESGKVDFPTDFSEVLLLGKNVLSKHAELLKGTTGSPLTQFFTDNKIVPTELSASMDSAKLSEDNREKYYNQSVAENALRDNVWKDPLNHLRNIANFLKGYYPNNAEAIRDWGFKVVDTPAKTKARNGKIKPETERTVKGIKLPSILKNTGKADLVFYKGTKKDGEGTTLKPGETAGLNAGASTITIVNTSTTEYLLFTIIPN